MNHVGLAPANHALKFPRKFILVAVLLAGRALTKGALKPFQLTVYSLEATPHRAEFARARLAARVIPEVIGRGAVTPAAITSRFVIVLFAVVAAADLVRLFLDELDDTHIFVNDVPDRC